MAQPQEVGGFLEPAVAAMLPRVPLSTCSSLLVSSSSFLDLSVVLLLSLFLFPLDPLLAALWVLELVLFLLLQELVEGSARRCSFPWLVGPAFAPTSPAHCLVLLRFDDAMELGEVRHLIADNEVLPPPLMRFVSSPLLFFFSPRESQAQRRSIFLPKSLYPSF